MIKKPRKREMTTQAASLYSNGRTKKEDHAEIEVPLGNAAPNSQPEPGCCRYFKSFYFLELIVCIVYAILSTVIPKYIPLNIRPIPYQITSAGDVILDLELNHALVPDTITYQAVEGIVLGIFIFQVGLGFFLKKDAYEIHKIFCSYAVALGSTLLITEIMKRYVGRLRPNFYPYCGFDSTTLECTNTATKQDWRMSFPSGHSSTMFCTCTLFAAYIWNYVIVKYTDPMRRRPWLMLGLSPLLLAYFIAASRIHDNYHFVGDVVGGSVIGTANAIIFSFFWFPSSSLAYSSVSNL